MTNPFNIESDDSCLKFLRQDSYQQDNALFENIDSVKSSSFQVDLNIGQQQDVNANIELPSKRGRSQNVVKESNSKKKMFYRDKMANLISQQDMEKCEGYNYGEFSQNGRNKSPISRQQQLKRNRQSAKHSRQRRKQYVQTLQFKNSENQKKIQQLTIKLRDAQLQRDRLKQDNRSYIRSYLSSKNEAYEHLKQVLEKTGMRPCQKLSDQMRIFLSKYGAAGSQRIAATDYYVKQIIQILLGDVHKYIVDCAINDKGLFGLNGWTKFDDEICLKLRVNKQLRVKLSRNYRLQMMQYFDTFKAITQKFYDAYRAVQNQAKIIQKVFQKISVEFNDAYLSDFLVWVEENKFSREVKKIRSDWARSVQQPEQLTGKARKICSSEMIQ